jgi:hypothetical protein
VLLGLSVTITGATVACGHDSSGAGGQGGASGLQSAAAYGCGPLCVGQSVGSSSTTSSSSGGGQGGQSGADGGDAGQD